MSRYCKHGVDCMKETCELCAKELAYKLKIADKKKPHAENMQGTYVTRPKPSLDDYDNN